MKIAIVGTGYVGLVTGTCFSEMGIDVTCVDVQEGKIENLKKGIIPIYEPGLEDMVHRNYAAGRLKFTTDLQECLDDVEAVFSAVGTDVYKRQIYNDGDKEQKKQAVLDRIYPILEQLPASLLKARLLTYTYGEVYEESLLKEVHAIVDGWDKSTLIAEQLEAMEELKNIEENPYPFEEIS